MQLVKQGKVKDVFGVNESELDFVFSNRISVFDKIILTDVPYKGETLARTSAYWFDIVRQMNIPTHYIGLLEPNRMRVKRVNIISDYSKITPQTTNYLIPLECVERFFVYGSLWDRIMEEKIKPEQLGFSSGHKIKKGEELPQPFFEVTTKIEKIDRNLTTEEALKISGIDSRLYEQMKETTLRIDEEINRRVRQRGLIHVDGKKEFALDEERSLMLVDTFGTADEDRFWDAEEHEKGNFVERSKEFVRQHYKSTGYYDKLKTSRELKKEEPPIPPLPENVVKQASSIYISLFEDITGQKFR